MANLQESIKSARLEKGLSLVEMAEKIGVSASMLCQVEAGVRPPSVAILFNMADVLDCSLDKLTGFKEKH